MNPFYQTKTKYCSILTNMSRIPEVLVPMAYTTLPGDLVSLSVARQTITDSLIRHNLIPLYISPGTTPRMIDQMFFDTQGVLFMGGSDIDPRRYGLEPLPQNISLEPARDELELYLAKLANSHKRPTLGICRGAQIINIAAGGTLFRHLPDLNLPEVHSPPDNQGYNYLITGHRHTVNIYPNSLASRIFKKPNQIANTHHRQAVDHKSETVFAFPVFLHKA